MPVANRVPVPEPQRAGIVYQFPCDLSERSRWVPPCVERTALSIAKRHPFYSTATPRCFLANEMADRRPAQGTTPITTRLHHRTSAACLFESIDDVDVAAGVCRSLLPLLRRLDGANHGANRYSTTHFFAEFLIPAFNILHGAHRAQPAY